MSSTGHPGPAQGVPQNMPVRQASYASNISDDAIPTSNPRDTSELLEERLRAWKHAVGYLEAYVTATEKVERAHAKEYERALKAISDPLREGQHFDQSLGGVAGLFENMRSNTQALLLGIINSHLETEKNLKGSVLPILERLHKEIKNKAKELNTGVGKASKEVEKSRNTTQKHVELLGQQTAGYESGALKIPASDDPYVTQRGVYYRLHKQVLEENNNRQDLISVQNNFASFEAHVVEVIQQALASFDQFVGGQAQRDQSMYADILGTAQRIPPDFEWKAFIHRFGEQLIDPNSPPRTVDAIAFANQNHKATQPLIEGTLERKSRNMLHSVYSTGYYVVTPSKYLHGFKDNDNMRKDPQPDISIYLPDATLGSTDGSKFHVKGKDVSKGLSGKLTGHTELQFKAHTPEDAEKWFSVIKSVAGQAPTEPYSTEPNPPVSPVEKRQTSMGSVGPGVSNGAASGTSVANEKMAPSHPPNVQTQGITGGQTVRSPTTATPTGTAAVDHASLPSEKS